MFEVRVSTKISRIITKKIPLPRRDRILLALIQLEQNPFLGVKMWGEMEGKRKIRIWPYRVIYTVDEVSKVIKIVEVGHRGHMSYK